MSLKIRCVAESSAEIVKYLDYEKRPADLQARVQSSFNKIVKDTQSSWGLFNGRDNYTICGIDTHKRMKTIIQHAPATQKKFYALEIGAGNFQWGHALAQYIDEQTDLPKGVKVRIFSVRGESYEGSAVEKTKRCKIYNFGSFKIEELSKEFEKRGYYLENKIDLIISSWCFRHLADPVGTFVQAYQLLALKIENVKAAFLVDGFCFGYKNDGIVELEKPEVRHQRMDQLFLDIGARFKKKPDAFFDHYAIQKLHADSCQIPMEYHDLIYLKNGKTRKTFDIGSHNITKFIREPQKSDEHESPLPYGVWMKAKPA